MFDQFLMLLAYAPGLGEVITFTVCFLFLWKKKTSLPAKLNQALFITSLIGIAFWTIFIILNFNAVLKPFQYVLMAAWSFYLMKNSKPSLLKISIPVAILIFYVFQWQFTFSRKEFKSDVLCNGVKTPVTASISYNYGNLAGYHFSEVNGKEWKLGDEWPSCDQPENMPQHYFGPRGLTFSHM